MAGGPRLNFSFPSVLQSQSELGPAGKWAQLRKKVTGGLAFYKERPCGLVPSAHWQLLGRSQDF